MFSSERFPRLLLTFQQENPCLLIFLKDDYTRMGPVGFYVRHSQTYQRIDSFSDVTVYLRRKDVPVTYVNLPAGAP